MIALVLDVPARDAELAADRLWGFGVVAVEERVGAPGRAELWTSVGDDPEAIATAVAGLPEGWAWRTEVVDEAVADTWRDHAGPTSIDDGFVVRPAWVAVTAGEAVIVVAIEPGSTFGLGDHPTTVGTLRVLRRLAAAAGLDGASVLDVGCGSGVLAIAAVLLGARHATGIDIAPAAVPVTRDNASRNGVSDRVTVSTTPLNLVDGTYDVVLANILAPALVELAPELVRVVAPGGVLVISGVLADRYDHVIEALAPLRVAAQDVIDGWAVVTLRR